MFLLSLDSWVKAVLTVLFLGGHSEPVKGQQPQQDLQHPRAPQTPILCQAGRRSHHCTWHQTKTASRCSQQEWWEQSVPQDVTVCTKGRL